MNINNIEKVCVVGWAKTGMALVDLLLSLKKEVKVSEIKEEHDFDPCLIDKFRKRGVVFEFGGHGERFINGCQLVILSPGVDTEKSSVVKSAKTFGIPYVGEIEFCFWLTQAKFVAITGTNGKTTTTFLTHQLLKRKNKRVFLGGNIGIPLSSFVMDTKKGDIIVLEISSFQLETIYEFRPFVACLLNVEPDHLNRYRGLEDYFRAKMEIFKNQKEDDWAVINKGIELSKTVEQAICSRLVRFSREFDNENFSCIYRIGEIFGLDKSDCQDLFSSFRGLEHRLQVVRNLDGVVFINDSKATNPSSTIWALKNIKTPIVLIAGGRNKGLDFSQVVPYLEKVKYANLFGESAVNLQEIFRPHVETNIFSSLKESVNVSFKQAVAGDTVLFSPMCASFDMFLNYMDRGNKFIEIVNSL